MLLFRWHKLKWRFNLDNILIDENAYENILVYSVLQKTLVDSKHLSIRFNEIDELVRVYDGSRYLVLCLFFSYMLAYE